MKVTITTLNFSVVTSVFMSGIIIVYTAALLEALLKSSNNY